MKKKEDEDKGKQNDRLARQYYEYLCLIKYLGIIIHQNLLYQEEFISHEEYEDSSRDWNCYSNKSDIFIIVYTNPLGDLVHFSYSFK